MTMNGAVVPVLAFYIVAALETTSGPRAENEILASLRGTIQNDILKEFITRNTYIYPPTQSMRIVVDIMAFCAKHMPQFNPISVSGYHIQEAGADPAMELGFTMANALQYMRSCDSRGLDLVPIARRMSFFFAMGMNFFEEIAKLRAARRLWAELLDTHFPALRRRDPLCLRLRTHCQTSGYSLTSQQPHNNIVRTTVEALSAVMGGTQSLHTNAFDEALALPSDFSSRIAVNTQNILRDETDICDVVDPWGGSWFMESLTEKVVKQAYEIIDQVEKRGGMTTAIQSGNWPKTCIEESAARKQARIDSGRDIVVGVNAFQVADEDALGAQHKADLRSINAEAVAETQMGRLRDLRGTRDTAKVEQALKNLEAASRSDRMNLLESAIAAAKVR